MRLVIDLQGAQTESRYRGIGRYSLAISQAIVRQNTDHEIFIVLNGLLPDSIESIRSAFSGLLPSDHILVWQAPGPTRYTNSQNLAKQQIAQLMREAFIASLAPDLVLITSLFEGYGDEGVLSIGKFDQQTPTAVILYDLIPLISPDNHFKQNPYLQDYYYERLASLKKSNLLLAISDSAKQEALDHLDVAASDMHTISGACDVMFAPLRLTLEQRKAFCSSVKISRPFIFYTGGADERKNLPRLIKAFARLDPQLKSQYQLVFAGNMPEPNQKEFLAIARESGLSPADFLLLGYVSDDQLIHLYNCCSLFVFPSLHEGLGIPPLEAMACGAPVIAANVTSLPEVIGQAQALFDPKDINAMSALIARSLNDSAFRDALIAHGTQQVKKFTWDLSAQRALSAIKRFENSRLAHHSNAQISFTKTTIFEKKISNILLIKLDHLGDFLLAIPAIAKLRANYPQANIDILVGSWCVDLAKSLQVFDRIYTYDFFKTKSADKPELNKTQLQAILDQVKPSYDMAIDLRRQADTRFVLGHVKATLKVGYQSHHHIDQQIDIILKAPVDIAYEKTSLNNTHTSLQLIALIDALPRDPSQWMLPNIARPLSTTGPTKAPFDIAIFPCAGNAIKEWGSNNYSILIEQLITQPLVGKIYVYFANHEEAASYQLPLHEKICPQVGLGLVALADRVAQQHLAIGNNSFGVHLSSYLGLPTIGIYGGHETIDEWSPAFENAYVISADLPCSPCHLPSPDQCPHQLACLSNISAPFVLEKVLEALGALDLQSQSKVGTCELNLQQNLTQQSRADRLMQLIAQVSGFSKTPFAKLELAKCLAFNTPPGPIKKLFIDISELVHHDGHTGIQRVVKSILKEAFNNPPDSYEVVPVYAMTTGIGYLIAHQFLNLSDSIDAPKRPDERALFSAGDIFLGLDLHPLGIYAQKEFFKQIRQKGVLVKFIIYDLLPITHSQFFPAGTKEAFERWLSVIKNSDAAICISKATANELQLYWNSTSPEDRYLPNISAFELGAEITHKLPSHLTNQSPRADTAFPEALFKMPTFLMVGTVEPRKGHKLVIEAFEQWWQAGAPVILLIIGKLGWHVDDLARQIKNHPQYNKKLFWFANLNDEDLQKAYGKSTSLIFASEGEGFGLPLIEAAQYELPIIARNLPVFQEIAGNYADYFSCNTPRELKHHLEQWLECFQKGGHTRSIGMPFRTWQESAEQLLKIVCDESSTITNQSSA